MSRKEKQKCLIASDNQNCEEIQIKQSLHELWVVLEGSSMKAEKGSRLKS